MESSQIAVAGCSPQTARAWARDWNATLLCIGSETGNVLAMEWVVPRVSPSDPQGLESARAWFKEGSTPLCWVWGPAGSGASGLAGVLLAEAGGADATRVISLAAAGPDPGLTLTAYGISRASAARGHCLGSALCAC